MACVTCCDSGCVTGPRVLAAVLWVALGGLAATGAAGSPTVDRSRQVLPGTQVLPGPVPTAAPPVRVAVVERGTGRLEVVPGASARSGPGPLRRYKVLVEDGLGVDVIAFARQVERVLADRRSWGAGGRMSFARVDDGEVDLRVVLASPRTTDDLCAPLRTASRLSCSTGSRAVINARRWLEGAPAYAGRLDAYRAYVVNHEVGHTLGRGHARCPGPGGPAPVMMQQTLGVGACRPSPWPYP